MALVEWSASTLIHFIIYFAYRIDSTEVCCRAAAAAANSCCCCLLLLLRSPCLKSIRSCVAPQIGGRALVNCRLVPLCTLLTWHVLADMYVALNSLQFS
jgi:hypothetical protein